MKRRGSIPSPASRPWTLRLSLGLNALLLGAVGFLAWRERSARPPPPPSVAAAGARHIMAARAATPPLEQVAGSATTAATGLTGDVMVQLEKMGLPRPVLIEVMLQNFNRRWDERVAALERRHAPKRVPDREYLELSRLRETEQMRELKAALGDEGYLAWDKERTLAALNTGGVELSTEEADRAYRLQKDFDEKYRELQVAMEDGVADPADAAALQELARQGFERETAKLLGQERYDRMRGVTTPVADAAWKFAALDPTSEQASAAAQVEQNYRAQEAGLTQRLGQNAGNPAALATELRTMAEARDNELRRLFGAESFDALQRQNDSTYQTLQQYAAAWELGDHEVGSVYDSLHAFQSEAERMRSAAALAEAAGQRVNWTEIDGAIEQARQRTETGLQRLIGADRLRRLRQNGLLSPR